MKAAIRLPRREQSHGNDDVNVGVDWVAEFSCVSQRRGQTKGTLGERIVKGACEA